MKTIKSILVFGLMIIACTLSSQNEGILKGTVTDENGAAMPFVTVAILLDSTAVHTTESDLEGTFTVKDLTPGKYDVLAQYMGYNPQRLKGVSINPNQTRYITLKMTAAAYELIGTEVSESFKEPVVDAKMTTVTSISLNQIEKVAVPKTDIVGMVTTFTPSVLPSNSGKGMYVRGARDGSSAYYVDGVRTMDIPTVPALGIGGMDVITGGIPAQYGDCTGGVVIIETKDYKWEMIRKQNRIDEQKKREHSNP
jgi:hypothetical protein